MAKTSTKSGNQEKENHRRSDNASTEARDAEGRFAKTKAKLPTIKLSKVKVPKVTAPKVKLPEMTTRNAAIGALGAGVVVAAVAAGAALIRGRTDKREPDADVASSEEGTAFDSDTAGKAMTPSDVIDDDKREAFAPATKPVPSRIEAMGNGDS